jgi:hypothetical protein
MKQKRVLLILVATSILALALVSGCEKNLGKALPNRSPETGIFLEGPLDTVRYSVKLYWWGQDSDGEVIGFYYRWTCADTAVQVDTSWVFTTERNRDFLLPVPNGFTVQTFWVKAVDNKSLEDPTPARQDFPVRNAMPSVAFNVGSLPDTTLPAATFSWTGTDPDGDNTIAYYVVWLDGKENEPIIVAGRDTTIGPDYIGSRYDNRIFYVRVVDEAQGASPAVADTWNVIAPVGDVLLVDEVPSTVAGAWIPDTFFRSLLDSLEGVGAYTVFDLGNQGRVKSPLEVGLILPLFRKVVWYGDTRSTVSGALRMGEQGGGIARFLDGGKMFLEGVALVGDGGSLSASFAAQYLGIDSLHTRYVSSTNRHSTNFYLTGGVVIQGSTSLGLDSLEVIGILSGCECMYPSVQAQPLYYLLPGTITGQTDENFYMGTFVRGGTFSTVCLTFPVSQCDGFGNARHEVAKLFTLLGIGE